MHEKAALAGALSAVAVVGRPSCTAIFNAIDGITAMTPVIAQADNAEHVDRCLAARSG